MFEVFTLKDWFSFFFSLAALVVSLTAITLSGLSYRLAKQKDRREVEAKKPVLDIILPTLDGAGPWPADLEMRNRSDQTIVLKKVSIPADVVTFYHRDDGRMGSFDTADGKVDIGTSRIFDVVIPPGASHRMTIQLEGMESRRIGNRHPVTFHVEYVVQDNRQTVQRFSITRIANP